MSNLKKEALYFTTTLISTIILILLLTSLYYFDITKEKTNEILKFIMFIIIIFINSFMIGNKRGKKGYLGGLELSAGLLLLFIPMSIIINNSFKLRNFIYYLTIILTSIFGSMLGINLKKKTKH